MVNGASCQAVKCGLCDRSSAFILPDGSVQVRSRHGGADHYTVIPARMIVDRLPISKSLRDEVKAQLIGGR